MPLARCSANASLAEVAFPTPSTIAFAVCATLPELFTAIIVATLEAFVEARPLFTAKSTFAASLAWSPCADVA